MDTPPLYPLSGGGRLGTASAGRIARTPLLDTSLTDLKVPLSRTPLVEVSSLSTTAPLLTTSSYYASGISDLRAALVAQQRQVDGLVDKVAAILSSMHSEIVKDVQAVCQKSEQTESHREMRSMEESVGSKLLALHEHNGSLRLWCENEFQIVRKRIEAESRTIKEQMVEEIRGALRQQLIGVVDADSGSTGGLPELLRRLVGDLGQLQQRIGELEEARPAKSVGDMDLEWTRALDQACAGLREEMRHGLAQHQPAVHDSDIEDLEERLDRVEVDASRMREHLSRLDAGARRHTNFMEKLDSHIQVLEASEVQASERQALLDDWRGEMQSHWEQWLRQADGHLQSLGLAAGVSDDLASRIQSLEKSRLQVEGVEGFQSPVMDMMRSRVEGMEQRLNRLESIEPRVNSVSERLETLASTSKGGQNEAVARGVDQRLDKVWERVDALATSLQQESRDLSRQLDDSVRGLRNRVEENDKAVETAQRNLLEVRSEVRGLRALPLPPAVPSRGSGDSTSHLEARIASMHNALQELKLDGQVRMVQHNSALQQTLGELRGEVDRQLSQIQGDFEKQLSHSQTDTERQLSQMQASVERLADKVKQEVQIQAMQATQSLNLPQTHLELRKEMEAIVTQTSTSQRLLDELRNDVESRVLNTQTLSQRCVEEAAELKRDVDSKVKQLQSSQKKLVEDVRREIEERSSQMHSSAQRVLEENHQLRQEVEARVSHTQRSSKQLLEEHRHGLESRAVQQAQSASQKLADELRRDVEQRTEQRMQQAQSMAQRLIGELRQDLEAQVAKVQHAADEFRQGMSATASAGGANVEAVRDAADTAAAALKAYFDDRANEHLSRCETAAEGCSQTVRIVVSKATEVEHRMQEMSEQLRIQLAEEGGRLIESLGQFRSPEGAPPGALETSLAAALPRLGRRSSSRSPGPVTPRTPLLRGRGPPVEAGTLSRALVGNAALQATIVRAKGLVRPQGGPLNAYCVSEMSWSSGTTVRTKTVRDSRDPIWNHLFVLQNFDARGALELQVWHCDSASGSDQLLGQARLAAKEITLGRHDFPLACNACSAGTITLDIHATNPGALPPNASLGNAGPVPRLEAEGAEVTGEAGAGAAAPGAAGATEAPPSALDRAHTAAGGAVSQAATTASEAWGMVGTTTDASVTNEGLAVSLVTSITSLEDRVDYQETALTELRQQHTSLRTIVEGQLLEQRVSRSLAGLESAPGTQKSRTLLASSLLAPAGSQQQQQQPARDKELRGSSSRSASQARSSSFGAGERKAKK